MKKTPMPKVRLDTLLVERGLFDSEDEAGRHIMAGEIWSSNERLDKAGMLVSTELPLEVRSISPKYVSRAGLKLEHALTYFKISVQNQVCLDVGASTGGFTDCLLQQGAKHVFAVDVGVGLFALRNHPQVTLIEKTNARHLEAEQLKSADGNFSASFIQFVCVDVSFISLKKILPALKQAVPQTAEWVLLFKPQFEVAKKDLLQGGIVKSTQVTEEALKNFEAFLTEAGFVLLHPPESSPLSGKRSGNVEILLHVTSTEERNK